jgi:WD40 repeat protein
LHTTVLRFGTPPETISLLLLKLTVSLRILVVSSTHPLAEIVTISRSDWAKQSTLTDSEATGTVTALAISKNGLYLASASQSRVYVWSTQTKRIIAKFVF